MVNIRKVIVTLSVGAIVALSSSKLNYAGTVGDTESEIRVVSVENPDEKETIEKIAGVVQNSYASEYSNLFIGNQFSVYNEDQNLVVYIYPIYEAQSCVLLAYTNDEGAVSVTDNTEVYDATNNLGESEEDYYLYICGGSYYAENKGGKEEIYDTNMETYDKDLKYMKRSYRNKLKDYKNKSLISNTISNINEIAQIDMESSEGEVSSYPTTDSATGVRYINTKCKISKFVSQCGRDMCWAASVATIVDYKTSYNVSAYDVCNKMGIGYDQGANATDKRNALKKYGLSYSLTNSKISWSKVKSNINNDRPFSLTLSRSSGMHSVTAYGYGNAANSSYNCVYIWDSNGSMTSFLYSGPVITNGYVYTWTKTVY